RRRTKSCVLEGCTRLESYRNSRVSRGYLTRQTCAERRGPLDAPRLAPPPEAQRDELARTDPFHPSLGPQLALARHVGARAHDPARVPRPRRDAAHPRAAS